MRISDWSSDVCSSDLYLNYWLTGRCVSEYGDASGTGYLDVRTRQWAFDILRYVDPRGRLEAALPEIIEPHQQVGRLRPELAVCLGLHYQDLVARGGGDNMMGAIGADNFRPGRITMCLRPSGTPQKNVRGEN